MDSHETRRIQKIISCVYYIKYGILTPGFESNLPGTDGLPSCGGNNFESPRRFSEGVMTMVTYSDLFQYSLVIIGIVALIIQIFKKK